MDRDMILPITLLSISIATVTGMLIKDQWDDYKWNKSEAKRIKLKEVESLIQHVKSMTAPKAIVEPPSLEKTEAVPQPKRRGRPSKAVTV